MKSNPKFRILKNGEKVDLGHPEQEWEVIVYGDETVSGQREYWYKRIWSRKKGRKVK